VRLVTRIAPDVGWLPISFVNVYFVGSPGNPWTLVDTGLPGSADKIIEAAEARFGSSIPPEAIVLTHGHFDHAGSALDLAEHWNVPIYAHKLELPYLTGRSNYPPADPTTGGAIGFLSRFMSSRGRDLGERVRELQSNEVPGAPEWQWIATPGHSPGHVSLFRSSDRALIAGDAFATMKMESWSGLLGGRQRLSRAGAPFNVDWDQTKESVHKLAELRPSVAACGHGIPREEPDLPQRMESFAARFRRPRRGRYVFTPAQTDESGVVAVPPAPFDPVPYATAGALALVGIALGAGYAEYERRK
jgi:glyoxylase-like metal-dependent hydrolase (beta-lactamase superfamily II)